MFISLYGSGALSRRTLLAVLGIVFAVNVHASPGSDVPQAVLESYQQAVASPVRTDEDRDADAKRKPLEFLKFADVRSGMRVLDVAAGGGYTTQLLALAVGSKGTVWAQNTKPRQELEQRLAAHPQPNIVPVTRSFQDPVPGDATGLDLVTIIMNYHDIAYMPVGRAKMDKRLFDALKPGGHLVVMDHSAKAGSGVTAAKSLHRIDEKVVKDEFLQAGFRLEESGDSWKNPADPREQAFFNMNIPTDKFALRFVKP
jgi:predicted methyltransferase